MYYPQLHTLTTRSSLLLLPPQPVRVMAATIIMARAKASVFFN